MICHVASSMTRGTMSSGKWPFLTADVERHALIEVGMRECVRAAAQLLRADVADRVEQRSVRRAGASGLVDHLVPRRAAAVAVEHVAHSRDRMAEVCRQHYRIFA